MARTKISNGNINDCNVPGGSVRSILFGLGFSLVGSISPMMKSLIISTASEEWAISAKLFVMSVPPCSKRTSGPPGWLLNLDRSKNSENRLFVLFFQLMDDPQISVFVVFTDLCPGVEFWCSHPGLFLFVRTANFVFQLFYFSGRSVRK